LGWYDRFHLTVGLPLLGLVLLGSLWLHKRLHPEADEAEEALDVEPDGPRHQIAVGVLWGGLALLLLAAAFSVAARTGIAALVQGPECQTVLDKISLLLEEGKAYTPVVAIVDAQLQRPLSTDCHQALLAKQARALLALAQQGEPSAQVDMLRRAKDAATAAGNHDLLHLVDVAQRANAQQQTIDAKQREIDEYQRLMQSLQAHQIPVQMTERGLVLELTDAQAVLFDPGKADLTPSAWATLKKIAPMLNQEEMSDRRVVVAGYTDGSGGWEANHRLSEARARRVADGMEQLGVNRERLSVRGYGASQPVASNDTAEGQQRNRRVEIIVER